MIRSFSSREACFVEINLFSSLGNVTFDCDIVMHAIDVYMIRDHSVAFLVAYPIGSGLYPRVFKSVHDRNALFQLCGKTVRKRFFKAKTPCTKLTLIVSIITPEPLKRLGQGSTTLCLSPVRCWIIFRRILQIHI